MKKIFEFSLKIILIVLLLKATSHNPYSYYIILRYFAFIFSLVFAAYHFRQKQQLVAIIFIIIGIIYNPLIPVHSTREIWSVINIITIIIIVVSLFFPQLKLKQ